MKKNIKFFFGTSEFLPNGKQVKKSRLNVIFYICYKTGVWILKVVVFFFEAVVKSLNAFVNFLVKDFSQTRRFLLLRCKKLFSLSLFKKNVGLVILLTIVFFIFIGFKSVASIFSLKNRIFLLGKQATNDLKRAKENIQNKDFEQTQKNLVLASKAFLNAKEHLENSKNQIGQIINFLPQKSQALAFLESAQLLTEAGQSFVEFVSEAETFTFSQSGIFPTTHLPETFDSMNENLSTSLRKVEQANKILQTASTSILPKKFKNDFENIKQEIALANSNLKTLQSLFLTFKNILVGEKNVLLIFQNNNELRPSGGFIGTYGNVKIKNGSISKVRISSVYDLDGQLEEKIKPPTPVLNVNNRWFLRDSNWFSDFSVSAKKVSQFYEKEGGETPDLVIAITPALIVDMLKVTGPVPMPKYGVVLNAENFVELTQVKSSAIDPGQVENRPKQILADFFNLFTQKLSESSHDSFLQLLNILQQNLNSKHILFYSNNSELQTQFEDFNWAGRILNSDKDYLQIVTANLGGTKTDLFIEQKASLKTKVGVDGTLVNELTVTRKNTLPNLPGTENISYLKVFVPEGSELLFNNGFNKKFFEDIELSNFKKDSDVVKIEKNAVRQMETGTVISQEFGKTVFANWLELKGGESKTVSLTYKLPFKISEIDSYSLLLQKQPGALSIPLDFVLEFPNRTVKWLSFAPKMLANNSLNNYFILNRDDFFGVVLSKK